MGKRVRQANGTYCYTENCRIHDRSYVTSSGSAAVMADARAAETELIRNQLRETINEFIPGKFSDADSDEVVEDLYNSRYIGAAQMANKLYAKVLNADSELSVDDQFSLYEATRQNHHKMIEGIAIKQGDEVIIAETGQRGIISEGNTLLGGRVRVSLENSHANNDFSWYEGHEVVKLHPAGENASAREIIVTTPRDGLITADVAHKLLTQESNPGTRNPQGLQGISKEHIPVVQEELAEAGQRFEAAFKDRNSGVTKYRIDRFIREEGQKRRNWLKEDEATAVNKAFTNIADYITPKKLP